MIKLNRWKNYKTSIFDNDREFMTPHNDVYSYLNQDLYAVNNRVFTIDLRSRRGLFGLFLRRFNSSRTNPFLRHPFYR